VRSSPTPRATHPRWRTRFSGATSRLPQVSRAECDARSPLTDMRRALETGARSLARSSATRRALPSTSVCQLDGRVCEDVRGVDYPSPTFASPTPVSRDWRAVHGLAARTRVALTPGAGTLGAQASSQLPSSLACASPVGVHPTVRSLATKARRGAPPETQTRSRSRDDRGGRSLEPDERERITWVDRVFPSRAVPYAKLARLDKPIGAYLLMWPCFWSAALAADAGAVPDASTLALFGMGSVLLRGAGCTVNDLWDVEIDKKVARTRTRPIASGQVTPFAGFAFLGAQLLAGFGVLLQFDDFTRALGASSLVMVAAYPAMKRLTHWPQAFLGLTINWGALMGWAAAKGSLEPTVVLPLYLSGAAWTLVYDTIYAHQDKKDDQNAGVRSTALHFGEDTKEYLSAFGGLAIAGLVGAGVGAGVAWPYYAGVAGAASHVAWQIKTVDLDDPEDCADKFRSNATYGGLVFAAAVAGKLCA